MPSQNIEVGLRFTADTSQAKRELEALKQNITNVIANAKPTGNESLFKSAIADAEQFYGVLNRATDPNGSLNLSRLRLGLNEAGLDIKKVAAQFSSLGPEGAKAWQQINAQIQGANANASILRGTLAKFAQGLKNTTMWTLQSNAIHAVQSALQGAYSYAQKLNKGLTDISIVSNLSSDQLAEFAKNANAAAKELSTTTNEYVKGALIYYQQGLTDEAVAQRTETTIKMANASGESAETISSYMTAIWNNFDKGSESVEYYADVIALLGATTAASNAQIAEGMQAFAATAETVGLSYEYSAAALTTLVDRTQQSASKIGTSLKTIFARLSSVSLGETLEDGVNLTKYTKALEKVGVDVLTATGDLKDMNDILDELGGKWDLLNQAQKVAVAQTVGGVRQYNNLISLLDNYDYFKELVNNAKESEGYLQTQQDKYAASWEGANKRVKASWETLYSQIIDDKFFITLANALADIVDFIAEAVKGLGGVPGILSLILAAVAKINPLGFAQGLRALKQEFIILTESILRMTQSLNSAFQGDAFDGFLESLKGGVEEYMGALSQVSSQLKDLNQKRMDALNSGNVEEASRLEAEIIRLKTWTEEALHAKQATDDLIAGISNVELPGSEQHQQKYDEAVEQLSKARFNQDAIMMARGAENPEEVINHFKDDLAGLKTVKGTSFWDEFFAGQDIKTALQNANIDTAFSEVITDAATKAGEATDAAFAEEAQKAKENIKNAGEEAAQEVEIAFEESGQGVMNFGHKVEEVNEDLREVGAAAEEGGQGASKTAEEIKQKFKEAGDAVDSTGNKIDRVVKGSKDAGINGKSKDWANVATTAIQASTSLLSMGTSLSALMDNAFSGEANLKNIASSLTGIGMSGLMATNALKKLLPALGASAAAAGWVVGAIGLLIAAYKTLEYLYYQDINAMRAEAEERAKVAKEMQEAIDRSAELSESIAELTEEYYRLKDAGESTYEVLDKMREQATDLVDRYKELAEILSEDLRPAMEGYIAEYEQYMEAGAVKEAEEVRQKIEGIVSEAQLDTAKKSYSAAAEALVSAGTGATYNNNTRYTSKRFTGGSFAVNRFSDKEAEVADKYLSDYLTMQQVGNGGGQAGWFEVSADAQSMLQYYKDLSQAQKELAAAGETGSGFYKQISKEVEALAPKVEEFNNTAKESLDIYAADFDTWHKPFDSMTDFMNQRKDLINEVKTAYDDLSDAEAEQVISLSNLMGMQEKLFQSWEKNLPEDLVDDAASYYDKMPSVYKEQFAGGLDYSGAVTENGQFDTSYLDNQLSERVEDWRKEQFLQNAESKGLDLGELQEYADYLSDIADESDKLADSLEEDSDAAVVVAKSMMSMEKGLEKLQDGFEDWRDALKDNHKESKAYADAMSNIQEGVADLLDVEKDAVSSDFVEGHLEEIEKAATGDADAIDELRDALVDDFVINLKAEKDWDDNIFNEVQSQISNLRDWADNNPIGTRLDLAGLDGDLAQFQEACNYLINTAGLSASQVQELFSQMGFETTFATKKEYQEVKKRGTITKIIPNITSQTIELGDSGSITIPAGSYETQTFPGHEYTTYDEVEVPAMTTDGSAPIIESVTKKGGGAIANAPQSSGGRGGGGGGGGGGSSKPKKAKKAERYHEITDKLDQQSKKIKEISTYEERAYGKERQKYVQDHIDGLKTEADLYGQLAKEAENYLKSDKKVLEQYGAKFNADGTIKNYDEWYNKWAETYKEDEEKLAEFEEAIKNYEESLDKYIDAKQSQLEKLNEAYDLQLKNINDTLKEQNDLIQDNLDLLEYMFNRLNDDGSDAADAIANLNDQMTQLGFKAEHYEQAITDLLKNAGASAKDIEKFLSGKISIDDLAKKLELTPEAIDNLREYAGALLDINENMYEMRENAIDQLTKALDKFAEEADKAARKTEFYSNHLNHLRNVIDTIGKQALNISNDILDGLANAAYQTALQEVQVAKATLDELANDRKRFAEEFANGLMSEEEYNKMMDELNDRWMDAVENLADKEEAALEAASQAFQVHLTSVVEGFEQAISGPYNSLDRLQDAFEKQKKLNDLYVDDYKKIHDLSKLGRDIQKSMDATDNVKAMEYLKELQDEVNDGLRDGNKLTEYNIEFLEKKYQLRLAEIALEEAQNAKNQVRMTRTSEGDWSYTYYADEEATANAQQNYEDKLFELEQLNQEYAKSVQDLIMDNMIQYRDEIADLNLTDEERTQLLQQYYEELQQQYGVFLNTALTDAQWIEGEFGVVDHNLINDWDETTLAAVTNFNTLEDMQSAFVTASGNMVDSLGTIYADWKSNWQEVLTAAGEDATDYAGVVTTASEDVVAAGEQVVTDYVALVDKQQKEVWEPALTNLTAFLTQWEKKIDEQIKKNTELVASIDSLIAKYGELATKAEAAATKAVQAAARAQAAAQSAASSANSAAGSANSAGGGGNNGGNNGNNGGSHGDSGGGSRGGVLNKNTLMYMDSGGYTGDWGNEGRLAMLHEKELVLNKTDTTNILNTVEAVRDIAAQLSANANISAAGLGELASAGIKAGTQFEQIVNITAEFPDAVYHDEIEQAFDNLLGRTAQFLLRK